MIIKLEIFKVSNSSIFKKELQIIEDNIVNNEANWKS